MGERPRNDEDKAPPHVRRLGWDQAGRGALHGPALMPPPAAVGMQLADTPRISAATHQRYCLNNSLAPLPTLSAP